jgi:hypothetical protein
MNQVSIRGGEYSDLYHYELVAKILADELSQMTLASEPLDVAETIESLSEEMVSMPAVINDCREAAEVFGELEQTLDRMYSLADRACETGGRDPGGLALLEAEFTGYSQIVARLAGQTGFGGPSLSLLSVPQARVARQVLGYLAAARYKFEQKLTEQRRRINCAMDEAVELLNYLLTEVEEISHETKTGLTELIDRLRELGAVLVCPAEIKPRWLN